MERRSSQLKPTGAADGKFRVSGHVDLRSGEWEAPWLRLRNVDLHTNVTVDNDQCSLTDFSSVLEDREKFQEAWCCDIALGRRRLLSCRARKTAVPAARAATFGSARANCWSGCTRNSRKSRFEPAEKKYQPMQAHRRAGFRCDAALDFEGHGAQRGMEYWVHHCGLGQSDGTVDGRRKRPGRAWGSDAECAATHPGAGAGQRSRPCGLSGRPPPPGDSGREFAYAGDSGAWRGYAGLAGEGPA